MFWTAVISFCLGIKKNQITVTLLKCIYKAKRLFKNAENIFVIFCIEQIFVNLVNVELISKKEITLSTLKLTDLTDYIWYCIHS